MECIGGSGVMENTLMPRLYREAPVNAIWEGSGNVQCLDVLRAIGRSPESLEALLAEIRLAAGGDARFDAHVNALQARFPTEECPPYLARAFVAGLALAWQASLLIRAGNAVVSDAFCAARLGEVPFGGLYGNLPSGIDCRAIIARGLPPA
jgi:putative acyl-CoA dehydrogenase